MKHLGISNGPFPAALSMEKPHGKVAYSQGVCCEGPIAITQGISLRGTKCIEMRAINGSKGVLKKWEKLAVIEDIIGYRVANFGWFDLSGVEGRG